MGLEEPLGAKIGIFLEFYTKKSIFSLDNDVKFCIEVPETQSWYLELVHH